MINNTQIAHKTQAMSTKKIAVLTEKRHADILRDTRKMTIFSHNDNHIILMPVQHYGL